MTKKILICLLLLCTSSAQSEEITTLDKVVDVSLYRPTGFIATILGAGFFAAMSPMAAIATLFPPHDSISAFADALVVAPAEFTFKRPIGSPVVGRFAVK